MWSFERLKKEVFSLIARVNRLESSSVSGGASSISVVPTGNLSSNNVQDALEELQLDIDGLVSGSVPTYTKTFGAVTTDTILFAEHGLATVHNVIIKTASDDLVSVRLNISGTTVIINSNVSLLNHKLLIY
jgi:hypothetical protein